MKRNYFSLFAAATMMLAVTSCSQEEDFAPQSSSEMTTFSVQLEGAAASRLAGDGTTAKKLYFEVYQGTRKVIDNYAAKDEQTIGSYLEPVTLEKGKAEIKLPLLRGEKYKIMFWAQAESGSIYDPTDLQAIEVNYKNENDDNQTMANIEAYDAFFYGDEDFQASANVTPITLRRPFAQLNIGTTKTDWKTAINMIDETNLPVTTSEVTVTGLANQFDVLTGAATGNVEVTFLQNDLLFSDYDEEGNPKDVEGFTAKVNDVENEYRYLAMNYLLVNGTAASTSTDKVSGTTDVTATFWRGNQLLFSIEKTHLSNVPIQRNWRTNILGDLLADKKTFTIQIDNEFENDENIEIEIFADGIIKDADGIYHITKAEGLYSLANLLNNSSRAAFDYTFKGQTFVLDCDIDLQGAEWIPMNGFDGTFDGKEKTIKNFTAEAAKSAGLFGTLGSAAVIKNLKVEDATITGNHWAGVIAGYGYATIENCHVKNSTVTLTTEWTGTKWDNGDKAGAIIGYLCEEGGNDYVKNCTADHVTIRGYRDIGGLVGIANNTSEVTGNTVTNSVVIIDKTNNPEGYTDNAQFNGGEVVGRISEKANVKDNTYTDVEITYIGGEDYVGYYIDASGNYIVTEGQGISNAVEAGATSVMVKAEIKATEIKAEGKTVTIKGEGENASIDFTGTTTKIECTGNLIFEGLTIKMNCSNYANTGLNNNGGKHEYKNCDFYGTATVWGECTYTDCTFTATTDGQYAAFAQSFENVTYNGCTFTASDRAAKICPIKRNNEPSTATLNVAYNECTFIAEKAQNKAAVEIDNNGFIVNVTFSGETTLGGYIKVNDYIASEGKGTTNVNLNGKEYVADGLYKIAEGEYELYKATGLSYNFGSQKATIKLINDIEDIVVMQSYLTIDGQNYKIDAINLNGASNVTLKNITFDAAKAKNSYDRNKGGTARQYANIISGDKSNNPNIGARDLTIDNCTFEGTFTNAGAAIAFTDRSRPTGGSGNVTIKNCTFNTQGGYYDIYAYYTAGTSNNGYFMIDNNEFKSGIQGKPVYLGNIQANSPITVKDNDFVNVASLADAVYYKGEGNHKPTLIDSGNTFAN